MDVLALHTRMRKQIVHMKDDYSLWGDLGLESWVVILKPIVLHEPGRASLGETLCAERPFGGSNFLRRKAEITVPTHSGLLRIKSIGQQV